MPKKKVRFIDPNKSISFKLQNRSQRDPLCVDPDAPQNVLVPMGENVGFSDLRSETTVGRLKRWSTQKTYGVGYEDDYDYMKHLRVKDEDDRAQLIPMGVATSSKRKVLGQIGEEEEEEQVELMRDEQTVLKLPPVLFPSEVEAEESLLTRGNSTFGPRPDWDPDIVAALDDDCEFENPDDPDLEDGLETIMAQLCTPGEGDYEDDGGDMDSRYGDFDSDDLMSDEDDEMMGERMETRSRFTGYSMSSACTHRSEGLRKLDEKFENVMEKYNGYGEDGMIEGEEEDNEQGLDGESVMKILGIDNMENFTLFPQVHHESVIGDVPNKDGILAKFEYERDHDEDLVTIYKKVPAVKHDAVSILSTYSNIYNRPKLIEAPSKPRKEKETKAAEKIPSEKPTPKVKVVAPAARDKNETNEEKRARKQAVKKGKKARRQEKKATKTAFQTEKTRRQHELVNIQKNLQGIKL